MNRVIKRWAGLACIALIYFACKKPFFPSINGTDNNRFLVIEGFISGNDSTFIKLSRTKKVDTLKTVFPEAGAQVTVESDDNATFPLTEIRTGTYAAPALPIDVSHKYRLRVKTADNKEYLSDLVTVKNAPPIDSVGFKPLPAGVQVYVNAHDDAGATKYYRWEYDETWQFHSFYNSTVSKTGERRASEQIYHCYGNDHSGNVVIASTVKLGHDILYQAPITIVPANSEKIETKYSILVKQYALTPDAYIFWETLQRNTEHLGSIFDVLPSEVGSNFHCVSNPNELVIGYLSVGNASYKRIFISADQLLASYSPTYPCPCKLDTAFNNPSNGHETATTQDYSSHYNDNTYTPVKELYLHPPTPFGKPDAISYSITLCVDCTVRGTTAPPPFWK